MNQRTKQLINQPTNQRTKQPTKKPKNKNQQTTRWTVLFEKLLIPNIANIFPKFNRTRKFITLFTTASYFSLFRVTWIYRKQFHRTSFRSVSILSSHLGVDFPSGFISSCFLTKSPYSLRATFPSHLIHPHYEEHTNGRRLKPALESAHPN